MNHQQLQQDIDRIGGGDTNRTLLADLRAMLPGRIMSEAQGKALAERLANRMRSRLELDDEFVFPSSAIEAQPRLEVITRANLRDPHGQAQSGLSGWDSNRRLWVIAINGSEYGLRQRFSLMHEYAHVIFGQSATSPSKLEHWLPSVGTYTASERLENLCDQFAASLLMPKPLVKRAWAAGHQDVRVLSRLFGVSKMATRHRMHDIGLVEPIRRHRPYIGNTLYFRASPDPLVSVVTSQPHPLAVQELPRSA